MSFGYSNTVRGSDRAKRNAKAFGHYNSLDEIISPNCPECGAPMIRRSGSGKRLIATVETDIQAENIYRRWKGLNASQKIEWIRSMQVIKEVAS